MNILRKYLIVAFLAVSTFLSGLNADLVSAQSVAADPMVSLTPAEKAWLKAYPEIVLGAPTDYPVEIFRNKVQCCFNYWFLTSDVSPLNPTTQVLDAGTMTISSRDRESFKMRMATVTACAIALNLSNKISYLAAAVAISNLKYA